VARELTKPGRAWKVRFTFPYATRRTPPIRPVPILGGPQAGNAGPWAVFNATVGPVYGLRGYNTPAQGVPASWPGPGTGIIPAQVPPSGQVISIKPNITQVLAGTLDGALATYFASMPNGAYVTCWHEGEIAAQKLGYTQAQVIAMHTRVFGIFSANAPVASSYGQIIATYSAYSGGLGFPLGPWMCTPANGGALLDFYGVDCYPITATSTFSDNIVTAMNAMIAAGVPASGPWTIPEVGASSTASSLWNGTPAQWLSDGWSFAQSIGAIHYNVYYNNNLGLSDLSWPPLDLGTLRVVQDIAAISRGDPRPAAAVTPARSTTAAFVSSTSSAGLTAAFSSNPAAGSKVLVVVQASALATLAVTDNGTAPGTFVQDASCLNSGGNPSLFVYRADNITLPASGTYAVSVTLSPTGPLQIAAAAYTGVQNGPPSGTSAIIGSGKNPATNPVVPADLAGLFFEAFFCTSSLNPESITSATPEFTVGPAQANGTSSFAGALSDAIVSSPAPRAGGWTLPDAPNFAAIMTAYAAFPASITIVPGAQGVWADAPDPNTSVTVNAGLASATGAANPATITPWSFIGKTASGAPNGLTSFTVAVPAGTANGDLMVLVLQGFGGGTVAITGGGWTAQYNLPSWNSSETFTVFTRTAASEPANYTVTGTAAWWPSGWMYVVRGGNIVVQKGRTSSAVFTNSAETAPALSGVLSTNLVIYGYCGNNTGHTGSTDAMVAPAPSNLLSGSSSGTNNNASGGSYCCVIACTGSAAPGSASSNATLDFSDFALEIGPVTLANAGLATAAGAAKNAAVNPALAGLASASGWAAVNAPFLNTNAPAGLASATGAAAATASVTVTAGLASATGAVPFVPGATVSLTLTAANPVGATGTAQNATASTSSGTNAAAGLAASTGAAQAPSVTVTVTAGLASATGAAQAPAATIAPAAGLASATGAAQPIGYGIGAGLPAATGTAQAPAATTAPAAGLPAATGTAQAPLVTVAPGTLTAAATGAALQPAAAVSAAAGLASATGTAQPIGHGAGAATAAATGTAQAPAVTVAPAPAAAAASGLAPVPAVTVVPAAGLAPATGTAQAPSVTVTATAGLASATGAAQPAGYGIGAGLAAATGAAQAPSATVTATAGLASATGAALNATAATGGNPVAVTAAATGVAQAPAVTVTVTAGLAAATGTAQAIGHGAGAGLAAATGTAQAPAATVAPAPAAAAASGLAPAPAVTVVPTAGLATGTGTAVAPAPSATVTAGLAAATGAAQAPAVATGVAPAAGLAAATATGQQPAVTVTASAGLAAGSGAALNASVSTAVTATAGIATASGTAQAPSVTITVTAGLAACSGAALNASASSAITASAGLAAASGTALQPGVSPAPAASLASASGLAPASSAASVVTAGLASATGVAQVIGHGAGAGLASASGFARVPALALATIASAQTAAALGAALQPVVFTAAAVVKGYSTATAVSQPMRGTSAVSTIAGMAAAVTSGASSSSGVS
jgi:hypothetical protein